MFGSTPAILTIFTITITTLLLVVTYYINDNTKLSCEDRIREAIQEERSNYEKLKTKTDHIRNLNNNAINGWLQSNGQLRQ